MVVIFIFAVTCNGVQIILFLFVFFFFCRPPSGEDPSKPHMKYDAVKLQDYEFKVTK